MPLHLRIEDRSRQDSWWEEDFSEGMVTIGRGESNVLRLEDAAHTVSRRHAVIRNGQAPAVMDLGSRNATYLNDQRLEPQQSYPLQEGDVLRIGTFRVELTGMASAVPMDTASMAADESGSTGAFETRLIAGHEVERYRTPSEDATREELAQAVAELNLLNELALEIGASLDAENVMDRVVQRCIDAIDAEQGLITLLVDPVEAGRAGADVEAVMHQTIVRTGKEFDLNERLELWMVQQQRPFLLNEPRSHPVFYNVPWKDTLRNLLSVPLRVRGEMTGLLTLYNKRGARGFTEADLQLASIIAAQSAHIIENARLFEEQKELLRFQQEMQVAHQIQTNLLPKEAPVIEGYDVAGRSLTAESVGGDHFDFIPMADGRWALCVGDVSGKGLPAALVMANLQATLRAQTLWSDSVKACLEGANHLLYESTDRRTFVTLFYTVLDPATHALRYANAGHNRPLIIGAEGVRALTPAGFLLGAMRRVTYAEQALTLASGETLLIFSDGVVEARSTDGSLYEDARLEALAAQSHGAPAGELVDAVMASVQRFAAGAPQADDITVMAIRRLPG